jgi:hypothetical protein
VIDSSYLPKMHLLIRCLAAIINAYFPKIYTTDVQFDDAVAERLLQREQVSNELREIHRLAIPFLKYAQNREN